MKTDIKKLPYSPPQVIDHQRIRFETKKSDKKDKGSFPGLGWGVDGTPAEERGDFPGGGGVFPGRGPQHDHRP